MKSNATRKQASLKQSRNSAESFNLRFNKKPLAMLIQVAMMSTVAVAAASYQQPAWSQSVAAERKVYELPAASLEDGLNRFSRRAGITLSYDPALVKGRNAPALAGNYSAEEGLNALLAGSQLQPVKAANGTFGLRVIPAAEAAALLAPETTMPTVTVYQKAVDPNPNAEVGVPYKAKTSGDDRYTRSLAEIPQTISVVTKAAIDDSGFTDLKQILAAQPGITLGTGENGNAFGDRYIIRGQEARSDVFVDGLRDPGMSTRESFAIEQLEITKGPSSTFAGRGSAGGAINAITKQATLDKDFTRFSVGVGTDDHKRVTADANKGFGDNFALRVNALYGDEDVPDRAPSSRNRQGVALSGLWEINPDLSVTLDYYGLRAKDDMPDLGSYLVGALPNRVPATNVPVYAQTADFITSDVDTFTARVKYKIAPNVNLTSLTRYGTTSNGYATTGATSATRFNGTTGFLASTPDGNAAGFHSGWQEVDYFAQQTNLRVDTDLLGKKHEFIFSAEYTDHKVISGNYTATNTGAFNCSTTSGGAINAYCFTNSSGTPVSNINTLLGRSVARNAAVQDWHAKTLALSAMDTVDLTERFTVSGGVRADYVDLSIIRLSGTGAGSYGYSETLVNGHLGLSYKITPKGMIYGSVASAQDINGGEPDSGISAGYGGYIVPTGLAGSAKPERSRNLELGTKWNLLEDKLLATAAIFQIEKSDVLEGSGNGYTSTGFNSGKNRVKGVEFGLVGNVTDKLTVQAGVAFMKSKILETAVDQTRVGKPLSNFADQTWSLQGKYQLTPAFSFGAVARHESDRCGGQPDTAADYTGNLCRNPVPAFTVYDAFAAYRFSKKLDVRLNVLNLTDKDYYTAVYRNGNFLYKGDARAVRLTLNYEM